MSRTKLDRLCATLILILLAAPSAIADKPSAGRPRLVCTAIKQTAELMANDRLDDAAQVANGSVARFPKSWLAHLNLSYIAWRQGNVVQALDEARAALDLEPQNPATSINLANMQEALGSCSDALTIYNALTKRDPSDLSAALGVARCELRLGQVDEGKAELNKLVSEPSKPYQWYYQISEIYQQANDAPAASNAADKAVAAAVTADEKQRAEMQLYISLLNAGDLTRAASLKDRLLRSSIHKNEEFFVLTTRLCATAEQATELVDIAAANLHDNEDADAFFRIAQILQDKAREAPAAVRNSWLSPAATACAQALKLAPEQVRANVALSAIYDRRGEKSESLAELQKAQNADPNDPFLNHLALVTGSPSFAEVRFLVKGLDCGCRLSRIVSTLRNLPGVLFSSPSSDNEYEMCVIIDPQVTSARAVIDECKSKAFATLPTKEPVKAEYELRSERPIGTRADAICLVQKHLYRNPIEFLHFFKDVAPPTPAQIISAVP